MDERAVVTVNPFLLTSKKKAGLTADLLNPKPVRDQGRDNFRTCYGNFEFVAGIKNLICIMLTLLAYFLAV